MKNFEFSKYCTPAQLYLVIGVICIISGFFTNYSIETLLTHALFLVIWAWVLNWLCLKGFKAISLIIVLLPFIFFLFMYFLIKDVVVVKEAFLIKPIPGAVKPLPEPTIKPSFTDPKIVNTIIGGNPGICNETCQANKAAAPAPAPAPAPGPSACDACGANQSCRRNNGCAPAPAPAPVPAPAPAPVPAPAPAPVPSACDLCGANESCRRNKRC